MNHSIREFQVMRKTAFNWYDVMFATAGLKKRPIMRLRNGLRMYYEEGRFWTEVFAEEPYARLDVRGKDVVDVGAFNGDSALYFAMRGARNVHAFEPMPRTFELAKSNLKLNNQFTNILLYNQAVGSDSGRVRIDPNQVANITSVIRDVDDGIEIILRSLESIVNDYHIVKGCLKLDCEGEEYDILLNSPDETIRSFSQIVLEYHAKKEELIHRLSDLGFQVRILNEQPQQGTGIIFGEI